MTKLPTDNVTVIPKGNGTIEIATINGTSIYAPAGGGTATGGGLSQDQITALISQQFPALFQTQFNRYFLLKTADTQQYLEAQYSLTSIGGISAYGNAPDTAGTTTTPGTTTAATSFAQLTDVAALTPTDGQVWGFKDNAYKWITPAAQIDVSQIRTTGEAIATINGTTIYAPQPTTSQGTPLAYSQGTGITIANNTISANQTWLNNNYAAKSHTHNYLTQSTADNRYALSDHNHAIADINGLQSALNSLSGGEPLVYYPGTGISIDASNYISVNETWLNGKGYATQQWANGQFCTKTAFSGHSHTVDEITDLADEYVTVAQKDNHTHVISQVTGLQNALDGKAAAAHNHDWGDITSGKPTTLAGYRIGDAYTKGEVDSMGMTLWGNVVRLGGTCSGDIYLRNDSGDSAIYLTSVSGGCNIYANGQHMAGRSASGDVLFNYGGQGPASFYGHGSVFYYGDAQILKVNESTVEIKQDKALKIGSAYISWDPDNSALKIADADGGGSINVYASGGVSACGGLGTYETVPNAHVTGRLTVSGSIRMDGTAFMDSELRMGGNAITGATSVAASGAVTAGSVTAGSVTATGNVSAATVTVNGNQIRELSHSGSYIYINIGGTRYKVSATAG